MLYLVFEVIPKLYNKNIYYELSVFFLILALLELCKRKTDLFRLEINTYFRYKYLLQLLIRVDPKCLSSVCSNISVKTLCAGSDPGSASGVEEAALH